MAPTDAPSPSNGPVVNVVPKAATGTTFVGDGVPGNIVIVKVAIPINKGMVIKDQLISNSLKTERAIGKIAK